MPGEALIEEILETHPLQLTVSQDGERRRVVLRTDTSVRSGEESLDPSRLRTGQRIRLEIVESGGALQARAIEILAEAPPPSAPPGLGSPTGPETGPVGGPASEPVSGPAGEPPTEPVVEYLPSEPAPIAPEAHDGEEE